VNVEETTLDEWASLLPETGIEPFHDPAALRVLDSHAAGELRPLAGYRGEQPVALFPAFVRETAVGTAVTSPPPGLLVPRLGPVLMPASPKRRKREKLNVTFTDALIETLDLDAPTALFRTLTPVGYRDPRPFEWRGLSVEPEFTYRLDLTERSLEEVRRGFSKSLRRELPDDPDDHPVTVECDADPEAVERVRRDVADYYAAQDEPFDVTPAYARDLVEAMGEDARVYVARGPDGEYLTGIVVLYGGGAAYFWLGGTRASYDGTSVNTLVHDRIIADVLSDPALADVTAYDLVGANTERLCQYKAKFGAPLEPYYTVESAGAPLRVAKKVYGVVRGLRG
jgi:hypothetical protein